MRGLENIGGGKDKSHQRRKLLPINEGCSSPEVVADFAPVPQHDDAARGEAKKVLHVVLALEKKEQK